MTDRYEVVFTSTARRAVEFDLPEKVATAAFEFIMGALRADPHRVGKPLREPLAPLYSARRGDYRVIYRIIDAQLVIEVVTITHRRDAYLSLAVQSTNHDCKRSRGNVYGRKGTDSSPAASDPTLGSTLSTSGRSSGDYRTLQVNRGTFPRERFESISSQTLRSIVVCVNENRLAAVNRRRKCPRHGEHS